MQTKLAQARLGRFAALLNSKPEAQAIKVGVQKGYKDACLFILTKHPKASRNYIIKKNSFGHLLYPRLYCLETQLPV